MCRARSYVWLNQFADQFVPILALLALRIVVGVGDAVLKRFSKPKKGAMQARILRHAHLCSLQHSSWACTNSMYRPELQTCFACYAW